MRKLALVLVAAAAPFALANVFEYGFDTTDYLTTGRYQVPANNGTLSIVDEGAGNFLRVGDLEEIENYDDYSQWRVTLDLVAANGGTAIDGSAPGTMLEFDIRLIQTGTGADGSAPYDSAGFNIQATCTAHSWGEIWLSGQYGVGGSASPDFVGGEWYHVSLDVNALGNDFWDASGIKDLSISGNSARGDVEDYVDIDNLVVTPEPASLSLLGIGLLGLIRRR